MIKHIDNEHVFTLSHYKQKVKIVNEKYGQVHYKKSRPRKPNYFTIRDSYEGTMQLNYNYFLKISLFLF
jgi:hypothetical protein